MTTPRMTLWPAIRAAVSSCALLLHFAAPALANGEQTGGVSRDGIAAYYVVMHAARIRADSADQLNRMEQVPAGSDSHSIMIVLFDAAKLERIKAAKVTATITDETRTIESKELMPHTMGGFLMYGNYFGLPHRPGYRVRLEVTLEGAKDAIHLPFDVKLE